MAEVIVTFKVMPEGVEVDLKKLEFDMKEVISRYAEVGKVEIEEIAFGLKALNFIVVVDENKGGTDVVEDNMRNVEGVNSVEVTDVRRAIGWTKLLGKV